MNTYLYNGEVVTATSKKSILIDFKDLELPIKKDTWNDIEV